MVNYVKFPIAQLTSCFKSAILFVLTTIEIINNTRGGIVMLAQSRKGNAAIGGKCKTRMLS